MRLPDIDPNDLSDEQQSLYDSLSTRHEVQRLGLAGPFGVWMHAPQMGAAMARLGGLVRFKSSLQPNVTEVAICSVGAYYRAAFEFAAHRAMALAAGVDEQRLDALARGEDPGFEGDEALAHAVAMELLAEHRISDDTYAAAADRFGARGTVELVTTIGYYSLISLTLNGFEIPLADGMDDPFT